MKKTYKYLIIFLTVVVSGCSTDLLDLDPKTSLNEQYVFDTKDRVVAQVNGLYSKLKDGAFMAGRYQVYNDLRAENFLPKSTNLVTNYATWNHSVVSSTNEVQNLWGAVYAAINAYNIFLGSIDSKWTAGELEGIITEAEYKQYKSEALALRAISYFSLLQMYAQPYSKGNGANPGVPLRLKGYKTSEDNNLARSTVAEVYTQILKDLNDAEEMAIEKYSTDLLNTTRIHKNTIIAFKTRVYLHMNDFAKVQTEAAKIVSANAPFVAATGVPFTLSSTFAALWVSPYTSKESIFSMPFTSTNLAGTQNSLAHYHHPSSSESYYLNQAAGTAYALLDAEDSRKKLFATGTVSGKTVYFCGKYREFTVQTDYAPVMRYAEVLLNYSEAIVRASNAVDQKAVDLLNAVRTRSFATGAYTIESFADVDAFKKAILDERSMEFLGEGIRNMDLLRTLSTIPGKTGATAVVEPSSPAYIWPIPTTELSINKLMTGN